jgi:hypothetical protein
MGRPSVRKKNKKKPNVVCRYCNCCVTHLTRHFAQSQCQPIASLPNMPLPNNVAFTTTASSGICTTAKSGTAHPRAAHYPSRNAIGVNKDKATMPLDLASALTNEYTVEPQIQKEIRTITVKGIVLPPSDALEDDDAEEDVMDLFAYDTVKHRTEGDRTLTSGDASLATIAQPVSKLNLRFLVNDARFIRGFYSRDDVYSESIQHS